MKGPEFSRRRFLQIASSPFLPQLPNFTSIPSTIDTIIKAKKITTNSFHLLDSKELGIGNITPMFLGLVQKYPERLGMFLKKFEQVYRDMLNIDKFPQLNDISELGVEKWLGEVHELPRNHLNNLLDGYISSLSNKAKRSLPKEFFFGACLEYLSDLEDMFLDNESEFYPMSFIQSSTKSNIPGFDIVENYFNIDATDGDKYKFRYHLKVQDLTSQVVYNIDLDGTKNITHFLNNPRQLIKKLGEKIDNYWERKDGENFEKIIQMAPENSPFTHFLNSTTHLTPISQYKNYSGELPFEKKVEQLLTGANQEAKQDENGEKII